MKNNIFTLLLLMLSCLLFAQEIPLQISYQGRLLENGTPVNGTKTITFTIGAWTETKNVNITNGLYSVILGESTQIPVNVFDNTSAVSLQIEINGTNLTPFTDIISVPYAYKAERAVTAENVPTRLSQLTNDIGYISNPNDEDSDPTNEIQTLELSGDELSISSGNTIILPGGTSQWSVNSNNIYYNSGNVGIGPTINSPQFPLHVASSQQSDYLGVGHFTNRATGADAAGISAICANDDFFGFGGYFTGGYCGVAGTVSTPNGYSNGYKGVYAYAENEGGGASIFALYARENGGDSDSYAGYFVGNVHVAGTLTKNSGSFKIDHPIDPQNKYLYHSFVESPDMMNIYNGNIILDGNGESTVVLPDYFEVLNMEFRYQLTCIGDFAQVYISKEVEGNEFKISGGKPGLKVSWQITGIRQDPYAVQNRISVEVDKSDKERGYYLNYKEYNQPYEKSIESLQNENLKTK